MTGVYTTNTTEAVHYQLKHSMANIAVVDGRSQLEKVVMMMMMTLIIMIMMTMKMMMKMMMFFFVKLVPL